MCQVGVSLAGESYHGSAAGYRWHAGLLPAMQTAAIIATAMGGAAKALLQTGLSESVIPGRTQASCSCLTLKLHMPAQLVLISILQLKVRLTASFTGPPVQHVCHYVHHVQADSKQPRL